MRPVLLTVLAHPDDESFGMGGTLARYAGEGVDVHIAIATDGSAGSTPEDWDGDKSQLAKVRTEEVSQAVAVLDGTLHMLNYRDSGYVGDPANEHPEAFINADEYEAVGRVVKLIRELRPSVVITHDKTGGYFHPDHIFCGKITTAAFWAAGDPKQYPDIGPDPHRPRRLYHTALPDTWIKFYTRLMRLRGKDPTKIGRNEDIDLTKLGVPPEQVHARINYLDYWDKKRLASAEHVSQGGGTSTMRFFPKWAQKKLLGTESFIRVYPPAPDGYRQTDLFDFD